MRHWTGVGSGLLLSVLEKPNFFHKIGRETAATDLIMDGSVSEKKSSFKRIVKRAELNKCHISMIL